MPATIGLIMGTRPEAIKLALVALALRQAPDVFHPVLIATAQHREMLDQALHLFDLHPDYDLNVMQPNQTLVADILRRILECAS